MRIILRNAALAARIAVASHRGAGAAGLLRPRVIVVGDLVTDVLVVHDGPIETGSDTAAAITVGGGGQAANTAAWLARRRASGHAGRGGRRRPAGRERVAELTAAGVRCAVRAHAGRGHRQRRGAGRSAATAR